MTNKKSSELNYISTQEELAANGTPYDPYEIGSQIMAIGSSRRTTVVRSSLISRGPTWKDGVRKSLFTAVDPEGEVQIFEVESAGELANLPKNAINIHVYMNLLAGENSEVAAELGEILEDIEYHTAHHTAGTDNGERLKAILRKSKLDRLTYQDKKIGSGIVIEESLHRKVNPETLTGPDGVTWK